MTKNDLVVELGDEAAHVGVYCGRRFKGKLLVRWHKRCARWMSRSALRYANPQEVVRYNYLKSQSDV
jgi:hypothetical protein